MHVISRKALRLASQKYPEARNGLDHWYRVARKAEWRNIAQARINFPHADAATSRSGGTLTIFNVAGNNYRLVTVIHYNRSKIYIAMVLTHAEYTKETWKGRL